ncbi:hypothetical protein NM208_g9298 [Fusarium decemcellulare]|uniref:Uncharacterized protein n=1 Tax=Fusarium decemcellulare TaxID=57161 RepID=A0ACC1S234_9HYPO|nr:hypothetical protein NM208_g9298 [Fusarium decemcellulare]
MNSSSDCLCSLISTALDVPRINPTNIDHPSEDHICLTSMDLPEDWAAEAGRTYTGWSPTLDTTTTVDNNNNNDNLDVTFSDTANLLQPPPLNFDIDWSPTFDASTSDDNDVLDTNFLATPIIQPKPLCLSKWIGTHFNKPTTTTNCRTPHRLFSKVEIDEARNFELYRLHAVAFELNEGDTLVLIDYPLLQRAVFNHTDCNGIIYKSQQFRVHSSNLLATGSPKFAEMLGPTYQFRIQRRRKLVNKLPEGIKYVLDLTPPSEGDELVFQMTELSLTPGLIKWWGSSLTNEVDPWLVCGHDDICCCDRLRPILASTDEEPQPSDSSAPSSQGGSKEEKKNGNSYPDLPLNPEPALAMKARKENDLFEVPAYRRIPDYCHIRHRNGIVRLLMFIEGKGLILDSAARMWTLVKLGTIFDCASIFRDRVTQWIMHGHNTGFIETLPEEALQIAFTLKIPDVAQSAFRILVNELALKLAATHENHLKLTRTTIFGRKLGDLPDELKNLVQHAARNLVDRVTELCAKMKNPDLFDFWDIAEWNRLRVIEQLLANEKGPLPATALQKLRLLMNALIYEVTDAFETATTKTPIYNHPAFLAMDQDRLTYVEPMDFERTTMVLKDFNQVQMLLCASPYNEFGTILDERRYQTANCKVPGYLNLTYQQLLVDATESFKDVIASSPASLNIPAWDPFVRAHPVAGVPWLVRDPIISLDSIEIAVKDALRPICLSYVRTDIEPPLNLTRHLLLTLTNNELKYLPLWAGGCDDGTGAVFEDPIPLTEMGPSGPGPAFHTGLTIPSNPSSIAGSMIEDMDALRVWGSTTRASIDVHDSISTVYRPDQVIAEDRSLASESFTAGGSEYDSARFAIPADHQSIGEAVDMTVETLDSDVRSVTEGRNSPSDDDDDMCFWDDESDSDDSVDTILV